MDLSDKGDISPRKKMAMGKEGRMTSDPFPHTGAMHPDASAKTGDRGAVGEAGRNISGVVSRGGKELPGQQAPDHGPSVHTNANWTR